MSAPARFCGEASPWDLRGASVALPLDFRWTSVVLLLPFHGTCASWDTPVV